MEPYQTYRQCMLCSGGLDLSDWTTKFVTGISIILFLQRKTYLTGPVVILMKDQGIDRYWLSELR